jgi:hypothetical protein
VSFQIPQYILGAMFLIKFALGFVYSKGLPEADVKMDMFSADTGTIFNLLQPKLKGLAHETRGSANKLA